MRLLDHALARLPEHDARDRSDCPRAATPRARASFGHASACSVPSASSRARSMAISTQDRRMHHLVHEPHLQRLLRADVAAGEDHVERVAHADEPRQPLRSAHARDEPELHFGQREHRLRVIGARRDSGTRAPVSSPPPRQAPWIAATTGTRDFSRRFSSRWPNRLDVSASASSSNSRNCSMSAPAMKMSGLPLR